MDDEKKELVVSFVKKHVLVLGLAGVGIASVVYGFISLAASKSTSDIELNDYMAESISGNAVQDGLQQLAFKDLLDMIQALPDLTRTTFNLFVFEGYSHKQIAVALGSTENASSWHVHHARKLLQARILSLQLQHTSYAGK